MQAFADIVRQGKALYIGVSEWNAEQIRAGHKQVEPIFNVPALWAKLPNNAKVMNFIGKIDFTV